MRSKAGPKLAEADRVEKQLIKIGAAEIVVGIPSYKEADTIAHVVSQIDAGLNDYFGDVRCVIVNVDNNSPDHTRAVFEGVETTVPTLYVSTPKGVKGKGNNLYNLLWAATRLGARTVVTVDADLASITPLWVRRLAGPIHRSRAGYVTPIYARNEYDGTITNHICYPLLSGTLGADLRQPIGGDFALSGGLAADLLGLKWHPITREYGVDIFFTLTALMSGRRVVQTNLGAKIHKPSAPKLGPMFSQVVTTLFRLLLDNRDLWLDGFEEVHVAPWTGSDGVKPQPLPVDYKSIKATAMERYKSHRERIVKMLEPESAEHLTSRLDEGRMSLGMRAWVRIVYDVLYAYEAQGRDPKIIEAFKALFFVRVASFIRATLDMDHQESEAHIRSQAREFRRSRRYLVSKFNSHGEES